MRLFRVETELRTYWVAAMVKWHTRNAIKSFLIASEKLTVPEALEIVREEFRISNVTECVGPDSAPEEIYRWFDRAWYDLGKRVYATQWAGEEIVLAESLKRLERASEREQYRGVARRRQQLKQAGKKARANAQRRVRSKK